MAEPKNILIVGETPENMDFSDPAIPEGLTPEKIKAGLEQSLDDLRGKGYTACLVYLDTKDTARDQISEALGRRVFDIIVIGAGLRIVPKQTEMFEVVMNVIHTAAPQARLAFNLSPDDSANAAERQLEFDKHV
ncbi:MULTISPECIES: hypothetical protein [Sphingobium]|uniref:Uncharacterized protein n=2 Tax=Sphingobium TaxID=165695 RepID=A0A5B8CCP4_SPHSA|nr:MULTISPECIES: hypothetical protein [Sphingobium]QDC36615.1 hypothetical protein FIL70_04505 [Sphingobium fuliginis ATCC 27551]QNG43900.1 hypothetical protein H3V42_18510 [Sphingobium yanoikuyae]